MINLRGANPDKRWYQEEINTTKALNVKHYDIPMRAYSLPQLELLKQLVIDIQRAPRPILVHCYSGADRTGLASAIALIFANDTSYPDIVKQVSWRYRAIYPTSVGKQVLPLYEKWLAEHQYQSSPEHFLQWLDQLQAGVNYPQKIPYPKTIWQRLELSPIPN